MTHYEFNYFALFSSSSFSIFELFFYLYPITFHLDLLSLNFAFSIFLPVVPCIIVPFPIILSLVLSFSFIYLIPPRIFIVLYFFLFFPSSFPFLSVRLTQLFHIFLFYLPLTYTFPFYLSYGSYSVLSPISQFYFLLFFCSVH